MRPEPRESPLEQQTALRFSFLDEETEPCVVVSHRMEIVHANQPAREILEPGWFGKRCFEMFPTSDDECAWHCPTIDAVTRGQGIEYCQENLVQKNGQPLHLGVAVVSLAPLHDDLARSVLLMRPRTTADSDADREELLRAGAALRQRIAERLCENG